MKKIAKKVTETLSEVMHFGYTQDTGVFQKKNFNSPEEAATWIFNNLPEILKTDSIPEDILMEWDNKPYINWEYARLIRSYIVRYIDNNIPIKEINSHLLDLLIEEGYPKK